MEPVDRDDDEPLAHNVKDNVATISNDSGGPLLTGTLDAAIAEDDWATVGAVLAMLAANADDNDMPRSSNNPSGSEEESKTSAAYDRDAVQASYIDQLVDAGDWEGVVLAAAKFATDKAVAEHPVQSFTSNNKLGSSTGSGTGFETDLDSDIPSTSSSSVHGIRAKLEALVKVVVPEESDSIDELMLEFEGREGELVEMLRTMQERTGQAKAKPEES